MAVNLIGRQSYVSINHQDKYPLAFILCFTFSNCSADLLFLNKCALCLELESLYSINLCPRILSYFHLSTSIFPPFLTFTIRVWFPASTCMHAVYVFICQVFSSRCWLKAPRGALLLLHSSILLLKDNDHEQKLCSLMAACSDFTGIVFTSDSTKWTVIFKITTGKTPFCHTTSPKNGPWWILAR